MWSEVSLIKYRAAHLLRRHQYHKRHEGKKLFSVTAGKSINIRNTSSIIRAAQLIVLPLILVAFGLTLLTSAPANPDAALQAIALSAHNSNKRHRKALSSNLKNRYTDGRYKQITRHRSKDGLQSSTLEDAIECECATIGATPLSLRVVSESEVFVECAGPDGPEYVRTGHFTQDGENRLCMVGKEDVFLVDEHQDIIHVERSPAIRDGCVWHFVDGEEVLAGRLRARQNSNRQKRALPGNTWRLQGPVEPHDPYYIAGGQLSRGGQNTMDIAQQAEELRIRESEITALLRND